MENPLFKIDSCEEILEKSMNNMMNKWNICSFSETYDNILMWSHYSNDHKGFCVEYQYEELREYCEKALLPIRYSDKIPCGDLNIEDSHKILFSKAKQWQYELEWRFVGQPRSSEKYPLINVPKPKAIYLGCKIEEGLKNYLIDYCKSNSIDVYLSKENLKEYKLDFKKLS
jgi:hypothetical protein